MNLEKENGVTGVDIAISIAIIMIFVSVIASLFYNVSSESTNLKRRAQATEYAIQEIENLKAKTMDDIANNELSYEIPETNPEEIAPGYNKSVKIEDYKELKGDDGIEENIIKKITVTVSYKVNGKSESITLEAMVTKES